LFFLYQLLFTIFLLGLEHYTQAERHQKGGNKNQMANLKDTAKAYQPKKTRNIAELEVVNLEAFQIEEREGVNNEGKEFSYKVAIFNGEEYRIPESVLGSIKTILEAKPSLKTIRVIKKGQGMDTQYTVIPLE
jgi:hypothetical protein